MDSQTHRKTKNGNRLGCENCGNLFRVRSKWPVARNGHTAIDISAGRHIRSSSMIFPHRVRHIRTSDGYNDGEGTAFSPAAATNILELWTDFIRLKAHSEWHSVEQQQQQQQNSLMDFSIQSCFNCCVVCRRSMVCYLPACIIYTRRQRLHTHMPASTMHKPWFRTLVHWLCSISHAYIHQSPFLPRTKQKWRSE